MSGNPEPRNQEPVLIINFKNYEEILGEGSVRLVEAAEKVAGATGVGIIVAPPAPMLHAIASMAEIPVFAQDVENRDQGKSTGGVIPESLKGAGCTGAIINHSESRTSPENVNALVPRMRRLGLWSCVCAESAAEVSAFSSLQSEFLAIEPPELIGTGIAVSTTRPELVTASVEAASAANYGGRVLCGAGIVTGTDASAAIRLGAQGILVASSVVKAKANWEGKLRELCAGLLAQG